MVGYDGSVLAFVEVKTRTRMDASQKDAALQATPESAVNIEKRRNISRVAQQFLRARHIESTECRFDVLAIETRAGQKPSVRLHKGAFNAGENRPRAM
jgi:Holliday junction resolvase-like predicted endonuclease